MRLRRGHQPHQPNTTFFLPSREQGLSGVLKPQASLSRSPSMWHNIYISQCNPDLVPEKLGDYWKTLGNDWKIPDFFVHAMAFLRLTSMKSALFE